MASIQTRKMNKFTHNPLFGHFYKIKKHLSKEFPKMCQLIELSEAKIKFLPKIKI